MQPLVGLALVPVQVAHGVEDHRAAAPPVGVHAQHRLLRHRPAGKEHGGGLAQQRGDLPLQLGHHPSVAVAVGRRAGGDGRQLVADPDRPVPGQEAIALILQCQEIIVRGHDAIVPGNSAVATRAAWPQGFCPSGALLTRLAHVVVLNLLGQPGQGVRGEDTGRVVVPLRAPDAFGYGDVVDAQPPHAQPP